MNNIDGIETKETNGQRNERLWKKAANEGEIDIPEDNMTKILKALDNNPSLELGEVREELTKSFSELENDDPDVKKKALETINTIVDQEEILELI